MPLLPAGLLIGVLATLVMDLGAGLGARLGIVRVGSYRPVPQLLARWVAHVPRGRFRHDDIRAVPPVPREVPLGMALHYAIGAVLGLGYVLLVRTALGGENALPAALGYGAATSVLPWFVMFPAMGFGVLGRRTTDEARLFRTSLYNHLVFGLGLWAWTALLR